VPQKKNITSVSSNNKNKIYIAGNPKQIEKYLRNKGTSF
jgi:hypothetical protein